MTKSNSAEYKNIIFRQIDFQKDLEGVIQLIKKNLDENYTLKKFKWKHLENPFGKSFGMVALDVNKIVGVRMFMLWEFYNAAEKRKITALRPVDTVTDKGYRKMGLFKKLNFMGLEEWEIKYDFIFNTPNKNSLPGNLNMGWEKINYIGKMKLGLIDFFSPKTKIYEDYINLKVCLGLERYSSWQTNLDEDFLTWRYNRKHYKWAFFKDLNSGLIIYKIKKFKGIPFIVIYDILGKEKFYTTMINSLAQKNNTLLVYFLDNIKFEKVRFLLRFTRKEPDVLFRSNIESFQKELIFSLGDLDSKL